MVNIGGPLPKSPGGTKLTKLVCRQERTAILNNLQTRHTRGGPRPAALCSPPAVHGSVQDEADDVAEVLRVQRATWGAPHVATDGHGDLPHFWVAVVTT